MDKSKDIGDKGEKIAVEYLQNNGYIVLETNWYYNKKEIDIICSKENTLIIVEVKTRSTDFFGKPEEAVTRKKQKFIIEATQNYIDINDIDMEVRFDVISIIATNNNYKINHITNAFKPEIF